MEVEQGCNVVAHYNLGLALGEAGQEEKTQQELNEAPGRGYKPPEQAMNMSGTIGLTKQQRGVVKLPSPPAVGF